jgi:hypothetical protein
MLRLTKEDPKGYIAIVSAATTEKAFAFTTPAEEETLEEAQRRHEEIRRPILEKMEMRITQGGSTTWIYEEAEAFTNASPRCSQAPIMRWKWVQYAIVADRP